MKEIALKVLVVNFLPVSLLKFINNKMVKKSRDIPIRDRKQLSVISGQ